jgi:prolipoprotein diacylglyceryltransferase
MAVYSISSAVLPVRKKVHWLANRTVLFRWRDYVFVTFGLFGGIAAFVGGALGAYLMLGQGIPLLDSALILSGLLIGHVVAARAVLLPWWGLRLLRRPGQVLRTVEFASWGGYVAIAIGMGVYASASPFSFFQLTDIAARVGPLAHAIGRLGCFTFGCCFGRPTRLPFAVRYDSPDAKASRVAGLQGVPIHPAPLYEAAYNVLLFVILNAIALAGAPEGMPSALYLVLYGAGRFGLEMIRYNARSDYIGPLPRNQWLSLAMFVSGLAILPLDGPAPHFQTPDAGSVLALLPVVALSSAFVFVAYSVHRGTIGRW